MLKYIRILLISAFILALLGAAGLYLYKYTHDDVAPPAFTCDSELLEVSVKASKQDLCEGLRAYDNVDGEITDRIMVKSMSQLIDQTDVKVSYIVFDNASNYSTYERTVRFYDYYSPRFTLVKPLLYYAGESVTFLDRLTATDAVDGDITGRMMLLHSSVMSTIPGTYSVTVSATNTLGDSATLPLTVLVVNHTASMPRIDLDEYLIYCKQGDTVRPKDYLQRVSDPLSSDPIPLRNVKISAASIDTSEPGVYEAYYYYTGLSGEIATTILTVVVE